MKRIGVLACVLAMTITATVRGQDASWLTRPQTPQQMLADQLVTLGLMSLQGQAEPLADQLLRACTLFDLALELVEDDPELWRLRAELADLDEDDARYLESLRQYARLRPDDDAVQLRLILQRVNQAQTIDARLGMVERVLESNTASSLSAALRSRLSSYAAEAALEVGDHARYTRHLKEALRLDETNVDAALMTYRHTTERTDDPLRVGAAVIHLIRSNPAYAQARMELAQLLVGQLAYREAVEQYEMAVQLARSSLPMDAWQRFLIAMVATGRQDATLQSIQRSLEMLEQARAQAIEQQAQVPPMPPTSIELLRLAILHTSGQGEQADASFERLRQSYDAATREENELSLPLIAAVFGRQLELAEAAAEDAGVEETARQRLTGWLVHHRGDLPAAAAIFEPLAESDGLSAYGYAISQDGAPQRVRLLRRVVERWPHRPAGMMAMIRLRQLDATIEPTDVGRALLNLMNRTPQRLWYTDLAARPWTALKLDVKPTRTSYLEPIELEVTLRNVSGIPLAVGQQTAAPSRLWVVIEPSVGGRSLGPLAPRVVDLGRTLRLDPGQSLTQRVRLDRGTFGFMRAANPTTTFTWRLSGTLDPRANAYGNFEPGPVGTRLSIGSLMVHGLPATEANIDLWLADLEDTADPVTSWRAVGRLTYAAANPPQDADGAAVAQRIAEAVNRWYDGRDRVGRAWAVGFVGLAGEQVGLFQRIADDAERSDDPLIRLRYLMAVADDAEHPALLSAQRHENPTIRQFAEAVGVSLRRLAEQEAAAQAQGTEGQPELDAPSAVTPSP